MGAVDRLSAIEAYWSAEAKTFDDEPDHGLTDPIVREAWAARLTEWIPPEAVTAADLGCGTGSLSVLLAETGLEVVGVDLSAAMLDQAHAKAKQAGVTIEFKVGDASDPDLVDRSFDVVLARHLVWALLDPIAALSRWTRLLSREGRLILVEGRWFNPEPKSTGDSGLPWEGGVFAAELASALSPLLDQIDHHPLSDDPTLWGKTVTDERYAIVAHQLHHA